LARAKSGRTIYEPQHPTKDKMKINKKTFFITLKTVAPSVAIVDGMTDRNVLILDTDYSITGSTANRTIQTKGDRPRATALLRGPQANKFN